MTDESNLGDAIWEAWNANEPLLQETRYVTLETAFTYGYLDGMFKSIKPLFRLWVDGKCARIGAHFS